MDFSSMNLSNWFFAHMQTVGIQFSLAKAHYVQKHLSVFDLNLPSAFDLSLPIIHLVPPNLFLEESANTSFASSSTQDTQFSIISHLVCLFFRLKNLSVFNLSLKQPYITDLKRIVHQGNELGMLLPKHGTIMFISP